MRFMAMANRVFRLFNLMYFQRLKGIVDERSWQAFIAPMKDAFQMPSIHEYWNLRHHWFDEEFQDYISITFTGRTDGRPVLPPEKT
jgi:hypothetical protein